MSKTIQARLGMTGFSRKAFAGSARAAGAFIAAALSIGAMLGATGCATNGSAVKRDFRDIDAASIAGELSPGWNLGNQLEGVKLVTDAATGTVKTVPSETGYMATRVSRELIQAVAAAGFKTVRVPVSYFSYIDDADGYRVRADWLARIGEIVDWCLEANLYCIVNMHGDGYVTIRNSWLLCDAEDQGPILEKYGAVWKQIAEKFRDYDERLIFESMNEEFNGLYNGPNERAYENINAYNELFVGVVRSTGGNNARRWLLIPGWNTNIDETIAGFGTSGHFRMPPDDRLMVSVHYYEPWGFCGGENGTATQWGSFAAKPDRANGTETSMALQFNALRDAFTSKGIPVILGEWGAIDKSKDDPDSATYRAYYARKLCENAKRTGVVPVVWDNGWNGDYGFALFDRGTKADDAGNVKAGTVRVTQKEVLAAIMETYGSPAASESKARIGLEGETLTMKAGATAILSAVLTDDEGPEPIRWESSDETVAVCWDGIVKAAGAGECAITATLRNGQKAECAVTVEKTAGVLAKLYCFEGLGWSNVQSKPFLVTSETAGSYEATLKASKLVLSNVAALYLKDIEAEENHAAASAVESCVITVDSVTVNGTRIPLVNNEGIEAVNAKGQFDLPILNEWNGGIEMIDGFPSAGHRNLSSAFPDLGLKETGNEVVVKFRTLGPGAKAALAAAKKAKPALDPAKAYHAFFGIQAADSWVFRNAWSNPSYGGDSKEFKNGLYDTENGFTADGRVQGTIADATFTKGDIEARKTFAVTCEDFSLADKAADPKALNVALVSTDLPFETVSVTDARLFLDGKEANLRGGKPVFAAENDNGYLVVYFINIWNSGLKTFGYQIPKASVRMELTLAPR